MANNTINKVDATTREGAALAALIDMGHAQDVQVKLLKKDLDEIKLKLNELPRGVYMTPSGNRVTISESEVYADVNPAEAKTALRGKRLGKHFLSCVKVQIGELKRYFSKTELEELRPKTGEVTRKYLFN